MLPRTSFHLDFHFEQKVIIIFFFRLEIDFRKSYRRTTRDSRFLSSSLKAPHHRNLINLTRVTFSA